MDFPFLEPNFGGSGIVCIGPGLQPGLAHFLGLVLQAALAPSLRATQRSLLIWSCVDSRGVLCVLFGEQHQGA